jgi:hypothetical protein
VSSFAVALAIFGRSTCAALVGMVLRIKLPDRHLDSNSKDVVKLVMGLIATMSALVLSLLIASATTTYDRQSSELKALSANILMLDQTLESYGPDARAVRDGLRATFSGKRMTEFGRRAVCGLRTSTRWKCETPRGPT